MRSGVHLGLGAGYEQALEEAEALSCTTVQIFTHSPRTFVFKALDPSRQAVLLAGWKRLGIDPVVSHASYLINIGSSDPKKFHGALGILRKELEYAAAFGCTYVVFHPGKYVGGEPAQGIAQIAKGLNALKETFVQTGVMLLLETAAGQGTELCTTFDEIAQVLAAVDADVRKHLGVCIDTCHLFAAGHDLADPAALIAEIERTVGLGTLRVIHVNDSKFAQGERKDRHEHIGKGHIGNATLKKFLSHPALRELPMILETPIDDEIGQAEDLATLRALF